MKNASPHQWHAYCVKNTFVEHADDSDDESPKLQRSHSWSGGMSSSSAESTESKSDLDHSERTTVLSEMQEAEAGMTVLEAEQSVPQERAGGGAVESLDLRHERRKCTPCAFMEVTGTCRAGDDCRFCHLSHADHKVQRPSKEIRLQCKKMLKTLTYQHQDSERDRILAIQNLLSQQAPHVRNYIIKILGDTTSTANDGVAPLPPGRCDGTRSGYDVDGSTRWQGNGSDGSKGSGKRGPHGLGKGKLSL